MLKKLFKRKNRWLEIIKIGILKMTSKNIILRKNNTIRLFIQSVQGIKREQHPNRCIIVDLIMIRMTSHNYNENKKKTHKTPKKKKSNNNKFLFREKKIKKYINLFSTKNSFHFLRFY